MKLGFTKGGVADLAGISGAAYAGILKRKSGKPQTILKLIEVLSLDPDKLIPDPKEAD